jgi:nicotianamine synthase
VLNTDETPVRAPGDHEPASCGCEDASRDCELVSLGREPAPRTCERLLDLYDQLRSQETLTPSPAVDSLFTELVRLCLGTDETPSEDVLSDPRIHGAREDLVRLCAEGETLLEMAWARRVLGAEEPWEELDAFPYRNNYDELTRLEMHALAGSGCPTPGLRRVCVLGGGPLPLTALLLHRALSVEVTIVDRDRRALELSDRLVRRLVPDGGVRVEQGDATCVSDMTRVLGGCDLVVLAALVGADRDQKRQCLRAIAAALAPGAHLLLRSADGLRTLLYPVVHRCDVRESGFVPRTLVHPLGEVVNSVLVARRAGTASPPS